MAKVVRYFGYVVLALVLVSAAWWYFCYEDYTERWDNKETPRDSTSWLAIHHDNIPWQVTPDDIQTYHKDFNKWESGIGYSFVLIGWKVYQTHPIENCNANALGFNRNAISICVHDPDKYKFPTRLNLYLLSKFLMLKYDLDTSHVRGHCELPNNCTECPQMDMDSLRSCLGSVKTTFKQFYENAIQRN